MPRRRARRAFASSTSRPRPASQFRHRNGAYGGKLLPETMGAGCAFLDYDARRLAGHPARQRHGLARAQAGALDAAPLSQQPQRHVYRRDAGRRPRRRALRDGRRRRRLQQRRLSRSARDLCRAEPAVPQHRQGNVRRRHARRAASAAGRPSARPRCGSTSIATACSISSCATTSSGRPSTTSSAAPTASRSRTARRKPTAATRAGCSATAATARSRTSPRRAASSTRARSRSGWRCSTTTRMAGRISSSPTTRSRTSSIATCATARSRKLASRRASRSAPTAGPAPAWASMRPTSTTPAGWALRSPTSTTRWPASIVRSVQGLYEDVAVTAGVGAASRNRLGFGCLFADLDLDGALDLVIANGHIDEAVGRIRTGVGHAQPPLLFHESRQWPLPGRRRRRRRRLRAPARRPRAGVRRLRP